MPLNTREKVRLRGEAMKLKETLRIGRAGATDGVVKQLDTLLSGRGLVKIRLDETDRHARHQLVEELAEKTTAEVVGETGRTAALWRARSE